MTELSGQHREYVIDRHVRITVLTRGAETDGRFDLVKGVNEPRSATALHVHTRYDERFWVVDGELTVWAGEERTTLRPGGFYTVPRNVPHMLQTGPEGATALVISSPAAFAELIERTATPAHLAGPDTDLNMDLFMKVTTELGDMVLGLPGTTPAEADRSATAEGQLSDSEPDGAAGIHAVVKAAGQRRV